MYGNTVTSRWNLHRLPIPILVKLIETVALKLENEHQN